MAGFIPSKEAELVTWSTNFDAQINNDPPALGLTVVQTGGYSTLHAAFVAAFQASQDHSTRTPSSILAKNDAKEALVANARALARIIQACPTVTDQQRSDLGLTVRDPEPTPVPAPGTLPLVSVVEVQHGSHTIRLADMDSPSSRAKPAGVAGAEVFVFIGDNPPADMTTCQLRQLTTRNQLEITYQPEDSGKMAYIAARWYNPRGQAGPASLTISERIAA